MSERPPGLDSGSHEFKTPQEEGGDSPKRGYLDSAKGFLNSSKEKLGSTKEKISTSWEKLTDKEQIAELSDKAELAAGKAVDSIAEYGGKAWQAIRHDAVPLMRRIIENKKVQLSTVEGAYGLLTGILIKGVLKKATVAGIRNVGNLSAPVLGSIAGAFAGGTIGGYERFVSEKTRIKKERGFKSFEALLSQEEIEKLKPTDRVRRLVAAKSFLNRERSRFESKGFYGDKGQEQQQLEMLRARLEAIDLSSAMSGGELRRSKGIYDRLSKALEVRDSADKEITAMSSRDLELISKCERKLSSGVDGAKVGRGIMVGGLVGGLGGLVGGLVGNWYFGSHGSGALKMSVNPEGVSSPHPEAMTAPPSEAPVSAPESVIAPSSQAVPDVRYHFVGDTDPFSGKPVFPETHTINKPSLTPVETPKVPPTEVDAPDKPAVTPPEAPSQAPVETPVEPKPSVPPVEVEKPAAPAPVETAVVDKNPSSIKLEKGQTIWGEVERISKVNGVELSAEEHNNIVRAIAEDNKIAIKADGQGLHGLDEFDTDLKPGHELNMSKSHELINEKLLAKASLPVEEAKPNPGGGSPEVPPPNVDTTTPPDTTPNGNTPPIERGGTKTPDGQELPDTNSNTENTNTETNPNSNNTNTETNPDNSNTNANTNTDGKAVDNGQESPANTNETDPNASADQGGNTNEKPPVDNPDGQGEGQAPADNPPAPEISMADYAKTVVDYSKAIGKTAVMANVLGGLALTLGLEIKMIYDDIKRQKLEGESIETTPNEGINALNKSARGTPRAYAPAVESQPSSLSGFESTEAAVPDSKYESTPGYWEELGKYKGLVGIGLDNFVLVMRNDGKSDLSKFVNDGYIDFGQYLQIRRYLLYPIEYSNLTLLEKDNIKKVFKTIYQIKDDNPRSTVQKIISQIVSWNPEVLAPIAAEVDESRKTRRVRKDDKKTFGQRLAEVKAVEPKPTPDIPKPAVEVATPPTEPIKPIVEVNNTPPEIIKNPEFIGAPFEAGQVFMMPNTLERYESGRRENKFIISRNEKTGELETIPKMKRLSEANDYYIYYKEYFDIADGQTASSGNIELIKPATFDYNANANNFELKEKGLIRIVQ
jgi:hypothetical protein